MLIDYIDKHIDVLNENNEYNLAFMITGKKKLSVRETKEEYLSPLKAIFF